MSELLSFEDIVGADDIRYETVEVPEWGGAVRLRSITGAERDRYTNFVESLKDAKGNLKKHDGLITRLLQLCLVDGKGDQLFSGAQVEKLKAKNGEVLERLATIASKLNGLSSEAIEEAKGNSPSEPSDESGTDSQSDSDSQ
jgi:hypothetical protein